MNQDSGEVLISRKGVTYRETIHSSIDVSKIFNDFYFFVGGGFL